MSIQWGKRYANQHAHVLEDDPTCVIVGLPDWYMLPDEEVLGEFAGKQARRVCSVRTEPDRLWHVLSINNQILPLAICESEALGGFALARVTREQVSKLLRASKVRSEPVLAYLADEKSARELVNTFDHEEE